MIIKISLLFTLIVLCQLILSENNSSSPIVLIPGDGGSRLEAYRNKTFYDKPIKFWVNYYYLLFPKLLTKIAELLYDSKTHSTTDATGYTVSVPGWGDTRTIEQLDEISHSKSTYFKPLVKHLLKNQFYQRNITLRGAPFDFRKAPNEMISFFNNLQQLVEDTFRKSGEKKVVLLSHSLGCLYSIYFLKMMPDNWKVKYLKAFISVSGPLGGSVDALLLETSGISFGGPAEPIEYRQLEQSFPSTAFLLPNPLYFGNGSLVKTLNGSYSAYDYENLFKDMNCKNGFSIYKDVFNLINPSDTPTGVEVYCLHGIGFPTVSSYFIKNFNENQPNKIMGPGDGKVNLVSLEICKNWKNVTYQIIPGANHSNILKNNDFLTILDKILLKN